jgi:hypothetical protein
VDAAAIADAVVVVINNFTIFRSVLIP